jgi:hypothetical protein
MTTMESTPSRESPLNESSSSEFLEPEIVLSETIIEAQRQADLEVDELEKKEDDPIDNRPDELPAVPKLLGKPLPCTSKRQADNK